MNTLSQAVLLLGRPTTKEENTLFVLMAEDEKYTMYKNSDGNLAFVLTSEIGKLKQQSDQWDRLGEKIAKCYGEEDESGNFVANSDDEDEAGGGLIEIGEIAATAFGWL